MMEKLSVLFLLLSAFSPPVCSRLRTFHFIPAGMSWSKAQEVCRKNYTDLVTVLSDEDNAELVNLVTNPVNGHTWIGLYRNQTSEKWSDGDTATFRNLTGDCGTSTCCTTMRADGGWESLQCTQTKYFMCYKQDSQTSNHYLVFENKSWYDAQSHCRRYYTDLVSIRDQQQNQEVKIKGSVFNMSFWIGLLHDDWQWADGGISNYRNWGDGGNSPSPNNCVVFGGNKWYSHDCNHVHNPLCYKISIHVSDVALSWEKALDYCREGNRAGILKINSEAEQKEFEFELKRRGVPPGSLWVGLGPNHLSEIKVSSSLLTCEDIKRQTDCPLSSCPADTHTADAPPNYVMNTAELKVVCNLK